MDDSTGIAGVVERLNAGETIAAARALENLWNRALKYVYAEVRMKSGPADLKRLLSIEEEIAGTRGSFRDFDLAAMVDLYRRGDVPALVFGDRRSYSADFAFHPLTELSAAKTEREGLEVEIELWVVRLKMFLHETGPGGGKRETSPGSAPEAKGPRACPQCNEPVQTAWTFCPCCETRLDQRRCVECGLSLNVAWKRCPECGEAIRGGALSGESLVEPVTEMTFVFVPGGVFEMGDATGDGAADEIPVHGVELDGFYLGVHPVTQGQWRKAMDANPSKFVFGDQYPVEQISFEDVRALIRRMEELTGGTRRFRLPTEAEWEYAARSGGQKELYAGGDDADAVAWHCGNSGDATRPVGRKRPNGFGLYDMSGNVWEWCADVFTEDAYTMHERRNPVILVGGEDRVIRGGNWRLDAWSCRCTRRFGMAPEYSGSGLGVRLVMETVRS